MPRRQRVEALIIGAGVAGLSAALWLRDFGVDYLVVEEALQPGGQLHDIHAPVLNYLMGYGWQGERIARGILDDARAAKVDVLVGAPVTRIGARSRVVARGAETIPGQGDPHRDGAPAQEARRSGRSGAAGARRERLRQRGSHGVREPARGGRGRRDRGRRGRARSARRSACPVTLIHRSPRFRARRDFLARALKNPASES